jgi:hypothetical protein
MRGLRCWWDGFYGTWLDPGTWATRIRLLLTSNGLPLQWPGIVEDGHLYDTDHPRYEIEDDREHEWMTCARCGRDLYCGWRHYYGAA